MHINSWSNELMQRLLKGLRGEGYEVSMICFSRVMAGYSFYFDGQT